MSSELARADVYDDFNAFAQTAYGAAQDSLVYEWFGPTLEPPHDWWEHVSEASAALGFTTNLPALTYVEFGTTTAYGQVTATTDRHYYQHLHHLTGLTPGTTYHYRVVMEDEQGSITVGADRDLTPVAIPEAIRIPDDVVGPPYALNTRNAYYLVTADIETSWKAFEIWADSVVLDLGGHTVTYNSTFQPSAGTTWFEYRNSAAFGIRSIGADGVGVYNGTIVQGAGQNDAHPDAGVGFNPIYFWEASDLEIAGTVVEYAGSQMIGIFTHWQKQNNEFHHNVFLDRGWEVTNRHGLGSSSLAIVGGVNGVQVHHNLVKRTRHNALNGELIHDNEIYIDSFATNAFGILAGPNDREAYGNKIFGTGYHVVGIGWGRNNWWHDNFIHLVGQGPDFRYSEYGNQESLNGFRLTQYAGQTSDLSDSVIERNLVLVSGGACSIDGECTQTRGLQYSSDPYIVNNVIRDNTIKVVMDDVVTQAAAIVTQGMFSRCGTEAPVDYVDNTLISNIANVRMGDYAGTGCNHRFAGNDLIRVGSRDDYRTLMFDFPVATRDHHFYDSMFAGGASYDLVEFSQADQEITVGWTLTVSVTDGVDPLEGALVTIDDSNGATVASGATDALGQFSDEVMAYQEVVGGRTYYAPIDVLVEYDGAQETRSVALDATTEISVVFMDPTAVPSFPDDGRLRFSAVPAVMGYETRFQWSRPLAAPATLTIYDIRGRGVRELSLPAGTAGAPWDGRDREGRRVGSGVYLARLNSGRVSTVCRVVVVR